MDLRPSISALLAAVLASGCAQENVGTPPPSAGFYFPTSVAAVESATPGKPFLYVVSSNFDLRYNRGTVIAVDTSKLADPPDGTLDAAESPAVDSSTGHALIDSFGGQIAAYSSGSDVKLFVPTRSNNRLYALGAAGGTLSCLQPPGVATSSEATADAQDCLEKGLTLEDPNDSKKRTFDPFGVTVVGSTVYITHLHITDDPPLSGENRVSYLASLNADTLDSLSFLDIGLAPAQGMALTPSGLYLAGRALTGTDQSSSAALRFVRDGVSTDVGLSSAIHVYEARGVALASDGARLFATTRSPDGLLVVDTSLDPVSGEPRNRVLTFVSLPTGPNELMVIPREGRRDLVAVSCTSSNAVAFYDDDLGEAVGLVEGILEPFGLARTSIPSRPGGQRLFVASFGYHTVAVIDVLDLTRPRTAALVGQLGFGAHRPLGINIPEGAK